MNKNFFAIGIIQLLFLALAVSYIPLGIATDSYLSDHRMGPCLVQEPACEYDTGLASTLSDWREYKNDSLFMNFVPNTASNTTKIIFKNQHASYFTDFLVVIFWMTVFNVVFFGFSKILRMLTKGEFIQGDLAKRLDSVRG